MAKKILPMKSVQLPIYNKHYLWFCVSLCCYTTNAFVCLFIPGKNHRIENEYCFKGIQTFIKQMVVYLC